jgi:predicted nucleic acid binding AN1-type Zn finger protein
MDNSYTNEEMLAFAKQLTQEQLSLQSSPLTGPMDSNNPVLDEPLEPKKKPANRCSERACNKKLMLTDITCKCCQRFCSAHRMPESHACTYDFKAAGKKLLETNLLKVDGSKMERI